MSVVTPLLDSFDAFTVPVFRVAAPKPVRRIHNVGKGDSRFELYFHVGSSKDWVRIETRLEKQRLEPLVSMLAADAALGSALRFPLDLTVRRSTILLPVDREKRPFTTYACGKLAVAVAEIEGRWVYVHAPKRLVRRLSITRERPADLRRFLTRMDEAMKPHRRTTERNLRRQLKSLQAQLGERS